MLTRRDFLATTAASTAPLWSQSKRPPNVLFLAADDLNCSLGCYGHPVVRSPHVDALAARGVTFHRAYCQYPLCGPSRASLLTGLRPQSSRVLGNNVDFREFHPDLPTLPQYFKNHGWWAGREGKMFHMNVPKEVGTPRFQDEASWSHSVSPEGLEERTPGKRRRLTPQGNRFPMDWIAAATASGQADTNAADHAIALLEAHKSEPFFLAVGFVRPHLPFVAPAKFFDWYPADSIPLPRNPPDDISDIPPLAQQVRPHLWNNMSMDDAATREALRGYYASTSFMDEQTGRVLQALRRLGLEDNTIVVFWGDHGWHLGEHGRWQKMSLMEESARVPLIIAAPGRGGNGKACHSLIEFVDLYPTLAALAGLEVPRHCEGQSAARLLDNPGQAFKKAAFSELRYEDITGESVRTAGFRYIRWKRANGSGSEAQEELYDHGKDPGEFRNLAGEASAKPMLDRHRQILGAGWRAARV